MFHVEMLGNGLGTRINVHGIVLVHEGSLFMYMYRKATIVCGNQSLRQIAGYQRGVGDHRVGQ